jgi:ABC-2 type transport system permease protein
MLTIARHELTQILRNRAVLVAGLVIPFAVSASLVWRHETFEDIGSLGYLASTIVLTIAAFSLYSTVVTTLASRRQNLFLKRLRSTAARDHEILWGLVLPATAIAGVQLLGILAVLAAVAGSPDNIPLFAAGTLATIAMMLGLGLATAGLTHSPEHAQVTTLPVSLGTIAVGVWVGISGTEDLATLKRLLPGGAATELMTDAWNGGGPVADSLVLLAPTLAWVLLALILAQRLFQWEPRR